MSISRLIFNSVTVILVVLCVGFLNAQLMTYLGVPRLVISFMGLIIGFTLPGPILEWLRQEEPPKEESE